MSHGPPALDVPGLTNPRVIGRGGFGTVYSADEPEFGRVVAVKVLHDRLDGDSVRGAFVRECQAMGTLSGHPHIVTVHRGGTTGGGEPYIVMDLMSAGSLDQRMTRDGPLPWAEVLEVGVTVAGALETAHRAGILHLDLKPANLLTTRFGETKLGDFGISRLPGVTETIAGRVRASIAYAAPERLLEGAATVASDLYGLGATLFALLTGRAAYATDAAENMLATVARVVNEPLPDLRPGGVPDAVAWVVEQLMAKRPADRFATAAEAAAALQAAQRTTGRSVTRAVVEGKAPAPGDMVTWPARPLLPGITAAPGAPGASAAAAGSGAPVTPTGSRTPATQARPGVPAGWRGPPPVVGPLVATPAPTMVGMAVPFPPPQRPAPPAPAPRRSAGGRRPLVIGLVAIAVVAVLGATGLAILAARSAVPTPTPAPPSTSITAAPTTTDPPPVPSIEVADGITHPATADAAAVLGGYFVAINDGRYADAFTVFSQDSDIRGRGFDAFAQAQSSTSIDLQRINAVDDRGQGTIEVDVTFESTQLPELGFEGQTCTEWALAYEMAGPGPDWKVVKARLIDPPLAC